MNDRFFTFTACHSGTGAASGKYEYASRGAVSWGRGVAKISTAVRSSSGNAWLAPASENHRLISSRSLSGCSAARSWFSERSTSVW